MSENPILAALARLEAGQTQFCGLLNNKHHTVLDKLTAMRGDTDTAARPYVAGEPHAGPAYHEARRQAARAKTAELKNKQTLPLSLRSEGHLITGHTVQRERAALIGMQTIVRASIVDSGLSSIEWMCGRGLNSHCA
jgi:hypothetical protein